ncbi:sensor histidine kinase [Novosphingobium sp.]|uniref:sensor histidine kinase n=1 Tax=unclassified Novosphingobium TaxID=2644732 RepID=UPI0028A899DD|nr:HWE histidine kinase domain-containing protein [Novosphingobium sp.]
MAIADTLDSAARAGFLQVEAFREGEVSTHAAESFPVDPSARLFITDDLSARPRNRHPPSAERLAVRQLLGKMVDAPDEVMPRMVAHALELTQASASGLSILDESHDPPVFRWQHLNGALARFEGALTPRHNSPCGETLDRDAPLLCRHPERVYDWIAEHDLVIPEVLLVPIRIGKERAHGTLWVVAQHEDQFDSEDLRIVSELADLVAVARKMQQDKLRLQEALEQQSMIAREMDHRVKNLFALTQAMIEMSARHATSPAELAQSLTGRLQALARAHAMPEHTGAAEKEPGSLDRTELSALIQAPLEAHTSLAEPGRVCCKGEPIPLGPQATTSLALLFNELTTNSVKYGSLGSGEGHVRVEWEACGPDLVIRWEERGGPRLAGPPARQGFGTKLMQQVLRGRLKGRLEKNWDPDGLVAIVRLMRDRLAD